MHAAVDDAQRVQVLRRQAHLPLCPAVAQGGQAHAVDGVEGAGAVAALPDGIEYGLLLFAGHAVSSVVPFRGTISPSTT